MIHFQTIECYHVRIPFPLEKKQAPPKNVTFVSKTFTLIHTFKKITENYNIPSLDYKN